MVNHRSTNLPECGPTEFQMLSLQRPQALLLRVVPVLHADKKQAGAAHSQTQQRGEEVLHVLPVRPQDLGQVRSKFVVAFVEWI